MQYRAATMRFGSTVTQHWEPAAVAVALDALDAIRPIRPNRRALAVSQDRILEKDFLTGLGLTTAPYAAVQTLDDLTAAIAEIGTPAILKTTRLGYDGKGQARLRSDADAPAALAAMVETSTRERPDAPAWAQRSWGVLDQYGSSLAQSSTTYRLAPGTHTIKITINGTVATSGGNIILEISQAKARKFGSVGGGFSPYASPTVAAFEPHASWRQGDLLIGFTSGGGLGTKDQTEPDAIPGWTWIGSFSARNNANVSEVQRAEGVGIYTRTYQGEGLLTIETGNVPDWNGSGYFHDYAWGYSVTAYRFATPLSGILEIGRAHV